MPDDLDIALSDIAEPDDLSKVLDGAVTNTAEPIIPIQKQTVDIPQFNAPWQSSKADTLPGAVKRETGIQNIPGNFVRDIDDMKAGLSLIGTMPIARMIETAPKELGGVGINPIDRIWKDKAITGDDGKLHLYPSDWNTSKNLVKSVFDDYNHTYIKPMMEGRFNDISDYVQKHPLNFLFDASMLGEVTQVNKLASKGTSKLKPQMGKLGNKILKAGLNSQNHSISSFAKHIAENKATQKMVESFNQAVKGQAFETGLKLDDVFHNIPEQLRGDVAKFIEGRKALDNIPMPAEIEAYKKVHDDIAEQMAKILQERKLMTPGQIDIAKYIPATMQRFGFRNVKEMYQMGETLKKPNFVNEMAKDTKRVLDDLGFKPSYSPWVLQAEVDRVLAAPIAASKDIVRAADGGELPKFMNNKGSAGEGFALPHEGLKARAIQVGQLQAIYDKFLKKAFDNGGVVSKDMAEQINKGRLQRWDTVRKDLEPVMSQILGGEQNMVKAAVESLPHQVVMPKSMLESLKEVLGKDKHIINVHAPFWKAMKESLNIAKQNMLAYPIFPEIQGAQQIAQWKLIAIKGPRELVTMGMSYYLAVRKWKELQEILPKSITKPAGTIGDAINQEGNILSKIPIVGKPYKNYLNQHFWRTSYYDHIVRTMAATQETLELSRHVPELGSMYKNMLKTEDLMMRMKTTLRNQGNTEKLLEHVNATLGDYSKAANSGPWHDVAKHTLLFPVFMKQFSRFVWKTKDAHLQRGFVQIWNRHAPSIYGDEEAPGYMQEQGAVKIKGRFDDNGLPYHVARSSISPYTQAVEFAQMALAPFENKPDTRVISMMHPAISIPAFMYTGNNPATGKPAKDPDNVFGLNRERMLDGMLSMEERQEKQNARIMWTDKITEAHLGYFHRLANSIREKIQSGGDTTLSSSLFPPVSKPKRIDSKMYTRPVKKTSWRDLFYRKVLNLPVSSTDIDRESKRRMMIPIKYGKALKTLFKYGGGRRPQ